jgi:phosphotransferase family enzyme
LTVLYATTVSPFDADGLAREAADAPEVISVAPLLEGALTPSLADALAHRPSRFFSIGIGRDVLRDYGTPRDHDRARGLDTAGIRDWWPASLGLEGVDGPPRTLVRMTELPAEVLMRLGSAPQDLTRLGSSRVLRGGGLVAKVGSPQGIAREAFLFGEAAALMPVGLPRLVDAGTGWILMDDAGSEPVPPGDVSPLEGLARVHELFEGATGIEHERFRDVFGRERGALLSQARVSANAAALPEPLTSLLGDPTPLAEIVDGQPRTLVHGDAWSGNVLARGPTDFVWLDWAESGAGPAAFDLAVWLYGSPWAPGSTSPEGALAAYLAARSTRVDPLAFKRAVDAAAVLGFLLAHLARLTDREPDLIERVIERRNLIAIGLFD